MLERLESIARQSHLKFQPNHGGTDILLSSEMYIVQVLLDLSGKVRDVRISHCTDAPLESCRDLAKSLRYGYNDAVVDL